MRASFASAPLAHRCKPLSASCQRDYRRAHGRSSCCAGRRTEGAPASRRCILARVFLVKAADIQSANAVSGKDTGWCAFRAPMGATQLTLATTGTHCIASSSLCNHQPPLLEWRSTPCYETVNHPHSERHLLHGTHATVDGRVFFRRFSTDGTRTSGRAARLPMPGRCSHRPPRRHTMCRLGACNGCETQ